MKAFGKKLAYWSVKSLGFLLLLWGMLMQIATAIEYGKMGIDIFSVLFLFAGGFLFTQADKLK